MFVRSLLASLLSLQLVAKMAAAESDNMANPKQYVLEPAAQQVVEDTAKPPFVFQQTPTQGRENMEKTQSGPVDKEPADRTWVDIPVPKTNGTIKARIFKPPGTPEGTCLPVILYTHGGGWVWGSARTFDRYMRDLVSRTGFAVVFPEYTPAPEAHYPVQNEQSYATAQWITNEGKSHGLDGSKMVVSGDSAGGNMALVLNIMAGQRGDVQFKGVAVVYPVTDDDFSRPSYTEFETGYYLATEGMRWFWDLYAPDKGQRKESTATPMKATTEEIAHFPPTLVITDECDVLRDEGEAFASKLRAAGVQVTAVRYLGMIHDFLMLNSLSETQAYKAAIAQIAEFLCRAVEQ